MQQWMPTVINSVLLLSLAIDVYSGYYMCSLCKGTRCKDILDVRTAQSETNH